MLRLLLFCFRGKIPIDSATTDGIAYKLGAEDWIAKYDCIISRYFNCNYEKYSFPCKQ